MKKLFTLLVALFATANLWAQYSFEAGGLYYNITSFSNSTVEVFRYTYTGFDPYKNLTTVVIPEIITYDDMSSRPIGIDKGSVFRVTSIDSACFSGITSLTSVTIPNSVTRIGAAAFQSCKNLTSVVIPNSVKNIGNYAFSGCSSLVSITIPDSVTTIGKYAFRGCSSLALIEISNSVTSIGDHAFYETGFYDNESNWADSVLYINNCLITAKRGIPASYAIKEDTRLIADNAFEALTNLKSVTIPDNVTNIGAEAFRNCTGLKTIILPNRVKYIGSKAFDNCVSLASITVTDSITNIGSNAFSNTLWYKNQPDGVIYVGKVLYEYKGNMSPNTSINVIEGTTCIGSGAFYNCSLLESITIPNSVTNIEAEAFYNCSSLKHIDLPSNIENIGNFAFYACDSLISVEVPKSLKHLGERAFSKCKSLGTVIWNATDCTAKSQPFGSSPITSFTLNDSIEHIPVYLCAGLSELSHITIPVHVKSLGMGAFSKCTSLKSVDWNAISCLCNYEVDYYMYGTLSPFHSSRKTIKSFTFGDSVQYIPQYICSHLDSVTTTTIGSSVTNIGKYAFYQNSSLSRTNYKGDVAGWCNIKFGGNSIARHLYINGQAVKELIIPNTVDSIHDYTFYGCPLLSVCIPNSVTNIGDYAFYNCSSLKSVVIPNSVTNIGLSAFQSCDSLSVLVLGSGVTNIDPYAFTDCPIDTVYSRNPTPPNLDNTKTFNSKPICCVPCYRDDDYEDSYWKKCMSKFIDGNVYFLTTNVSDSLAGRIEVMEELRCDKGAQFQAIPNVGFEFISWSDSITDPFRSLDLTQDTTLIAEFRQLFDGKCGEQLFWKYNNTKLIVHGEGAMYDYASDSVPWLQFANDIKTVEVFDGATAVGNNAFTLCKNLNTLTLPSTITNIGKNAFGGCRMLYDIYCYALFPPAADESSFINYNAYLYIICDNQRYYAVDMVFGNFRNVQCLGAETTTTDSVIVSPSYNDVTITWPTDDNAGSYTLVIHKDGEVFCTLLFNAEGQLMGIAFAPSRNDSHHAPAATHSSLGLTFTITGLEEGGNYTYTVIVLDNNGNTLQTYSGEFRTPSINDRTVIIDYNALHGEVTGAGTYLVGDTVTLTAIPNEGYRFVRWSNEVIENPYTFIINENVALFAEFEKEQLSNLENCPSPISNSQKLLRNGQLYIYHNGSTYNAMGMEL